LASGGLWAIIHVSPLENAIYALFIKYNTCIDHIDEELKKY